MVKLVIANQALNRQHCLSLETIKHLQKTNIQYQRTNNAQDQMVIIQSLESELERERKVRIEAENDLREMKQQVSAFFKKNRIKTYSAFEINSFEFIALKRILSLFFETFIL
jgi:hypothetical protein